MEDTFLKQEDNAEYWRAEYEALLVKYHKLLIECDKLKSEVFWLKTLRDIRKEDGR